VRRAMRLLMAHTCVMLHLLAHLSIPPFFSRMRGHQRRVSCLFRHLCRRCPRLASDAPPPSPTPPQSVVSYTSYTSDVLPCEKSPLCCRLHLRVSWMPDALLSKTITLSDTNSSFLPSPSSLSLSPLPLVNRGWRLFCRCVSGIESIPFRILAPNVSSFSPSSHALSQ
jgi:hypothetical protein